MSAPCRSRLRGMAALAAVLVAFSVGAEEAATTPSFELSGSIKTLYTVSRTPVTGERYWSDLNRFRLELDARLNETVSATAIIDNEFLIGTLIETPEFQIAKEFETNNRWDLDNLVVDNNNLVWRANAYRAYATFDFDSAKLVAGRQRIAWGTGRIWNPTDLFNPISPLQVEQNLREGIDGINAEYFVGALSSINLVYALGETSDQNSLALRTGTNIAGYDIGLMGGSFRRDNVIGVDFGGSIGSVGLRGEATYTNPDNGSTFTRVVLSADYSWPNSLYVLVEYLYNGGNFADGELSDAELEARERFFNGEIVTENQNFIAVGAGYELTPLLRLNGVSIYDLDDGSVFVTPSLSWNLRTNLDWILGGQFFAGSDDSEYGDNDTLLFTSLKIYF